MVHLVEPHSFAFELSWTMPVTAVVIEAAGPTVTDEPPFTVTASISGAPAANTVEALKIKKPLNKIVVDKKTETSFVFCI